MNVSLHGLLLAGGRSSRMGRDKASIVVGGAGLTQARRALELIRPLCEHTHLSLREGQPVPEGGEGFRVLRDDHEAEGPLRGILTAFRAEPAAAWLVLACDLPFVTGSTLARLVRGHREDPQRAFVAYANPLDGQPEPLCAIYTPAALPVLQKHAACGIFSPRRIMMEENTLLLDLPAGVTLANINTPQDMADPSRAGAGRVRPQAP
jgi:molybdopterin-guanine dinucleotide biosynthesis protein A